MWFCRTCLSLCLGIDLEVTATLATHFQDRPTPFPDCSIDRWSKTQHLLPMHTRNLHMQAAQRGAEHIIPRTANLCHSPTPTKGNIRFWVNLNSSHPFCVTSLVLVPTLLPAYLVPGLWSPGFDLGLLLDTLRSNSAGQQMMSLHLLCCLMVLETGWDDIRKLTSPFYTVSSTVGTLGQLHY